MNLIKEYVDKLIAHLEPEDVPNDPINWAKLRCGSVDREIVVYVTGLAPGSHDTQTYLMDKLKERFPQEDFTVYTEW